MISIIVAVAKNGVIGGGNTLLWHISEDLQRFKRITTGHPVLMGRKTFESLGRALPRRRNIVITRNAAYAPQGAETAESLEQALSMTDGCEEVFVTGGGEIYRQAMDFADRIYITRFEADYEGDTYFPEVDPAVWEPVFREYHARGKDFPHPFEYVDYIRIHTLK